MNKTMRTKFTRALALCCVMAVAVGSFAYFSDREDNSATPMNFTLDDKGIDIRPVDPDNPVDPVNPDPTPGKTIEDIWDANVEDGKIEDEDVYPGKDIDLSYDLVNASNIAVDIRETIVLTVKDYKNADLPLTATQEYRLFERAVLDAYGAKDGEAPITVESVNGNVVVYKVAPYAIEGMNEDLDGDGVIENRVDRKFVLVMNKAAKNAFQASTCKIDLLVEAKQHADGGPDKGWVEAATGSVTLGGLGSVSAVPAAPAP